MQKISYFGKMPDFVEFEAAVDDDDYNSEVDDTNVSDIDDNNYDESVNTYYAFSGST